MTLIRTRLLVATLALPIGVLMNPEGTKSSWWVLWMALIAVGALSAVFWLGVRIRRGFSVQTWAQIVTDLLVVTALSAWTGGRNSQFVLFYALVVITGGLLNRLGGGLGAAAAACGAFSALPAISSLVGATATGPTVWASPPAGLVIAYLTMMGVLSGVLGDRVQRTRDDLDRTTRELDRVRVDNDAILRHLTTGVLTVDGHGTIAYLNPAAEQVLGVRTLDVRGRRIGNALPERLGPLRGLVEETLDRHAPKARAELALKNTNGRTLPLGISTNLLMHEGRSTGVVAVFQDLTEVREMERRARRNQTLAEIGALSARIAHELRNGLNPISGSVECLTRELKLEGENAVLMGLIMTECNRLNRFVTDLLNFTRERDLVLEMFDLEDHLAELAESIVRDPRRPSAVRVVFERQGVPVSVRADREQMRQVWLNLASNAIEAMPSGGALTIRWLAGEDGMVAIEFIDDGPGIATDDLSRVGQPFFTTKQGGTGLGLAIAQRIVERHGGVLVLENASRRGTVARIALPGATAQLTQVA